MQVYDRSDPEYYNSIPRSPSRYERLATIWPIVVRAVRDAGNSFTVATPRLDSLKKDYDFNSERIGRQVTTALGEKVTYDYQPSTVFKLKDMSQFQTAEQIRDHFLISAVRGVVSHTEQTIERRGATLIVIRPLWEGEVPGERENVRITYCVVNGLPIRVILSALDDGSFLLGVDTGFGLA